jgi:hypothetical protein
MLRFLGFSHEKLRNRSTHRYKKFEDECYLFVISLD